MRKWLILLVLVPLIVAAAGYVQGKMEEGVTVRVVAVQRGDVSSRLSATGKVTSAREAEVGACRPGRIVAVSVTEGSSVRKGQLLALLDDAEERERLAKAQAARQQAREKSVQLRTKFEALRQVYAVGGTSLQSVNDARAELTASEGAERQAAGDLREAQLALEQKRICAPFSGVVTRRWLNLGEWASPGTPVFTLVRPEERELEVMVDEADGGVVSVGQTVEISCDAFPERVWLERVTRVDPAVHKEDNVNTVSVRVSCGRQAPSLRFGQQINAKICLAQRSGVLRLPFEAVISRDGKSFLAATRDGMVHLQQVTTGIEDASQVEIVAGARPGEEFILPEGKVLREGQRVKGVVRERLP